MNITPEAEKIMNEWIESGDPDKLSHAGLIRSTLTNPSLLKAQGLFTQEEVNDAYKKGADVGWSAGHNAHENTPKKTFLNVLPPYKQ